MDDLYDYTVRELRQMAEEKNINLGQAKKKDDIINKIAIVLGLKTPEAVMARMTETKVIREAQEEIDEEKVLDCCRFGDRRYLAVVKIPDYVFAMSAKPLYRSTGCKNIGFYLSSGTSNETNFPGMWFPFTCVEPVGWIRKEKGLDLFFRRYWLENKDIFGVKIVQKFLEKFAHFWQVRISAGMPSDPDSLWNKIPAMIKLKEFALTHVYNERTRTIEKTDIPPVYYILPDCAQKRFETTEQGYIQVNDFLAENNALCVTPSITE